MIKKLILPLIIASVGIANARADFTGYYAFPHNSGGQFHQEFFDEGPLTIAENNWSIFVQYHASFGGVSFPYVSATDSELFINSGQPSGVPTVAQSETLEVSSVAPGAGFLNFDFELHLQANEFTASEGYYFINDTIFSLPEGTGTVSNVALKAGDTFGYGVSFDAFGLFIDANANLRVTNFSAPVPEAGSNALLSLGAFVCLATGAVSRRRIGALHS